MVGSHHRIIRTLVAILPTMVYSVLFLSQPLVAQSNTPWSQGRSDPQDLIIQLVTTEPGDEIYTWWGHTAIIVEDTNFNYSRFYNFGLFSFQEENFFVNFARGRLYFEVDSTPTKASLEVYKRRNRTIHIQTLNLPPAKRLEVALLLDINILPENKRYLYDHYYDNCATRVRDLIDVVVDGMLSEAASVDTEFTLRDQTRRFTGKSFLMDLLLMFLMNDTIDQPTSKWEDMFLPMELMKQVGELEVKDEHGGTVPLVSETKVFYWADNREPIPERMKAPIGLSLLIGLFIGAVGAVFWVLAGAERPGRHKIGRIGSGTHSALIGLVVGGPGLFLFIVAIFTDHTVTYWNENLFLANPLTFAALPLGILTALGKGRSKNILKWVWRAQLVLVLLMLLLKIFPVFDQYNWPSISLLLLESLHHF